MKQIYKIKTFIAIAVVFSMTAGLFGQTTPVQVWVLSGGISGNAIVERMAPSGGVPTEDVVLEVVSFYPNPASDVLNIRANNIKTIEIINMMGAIIINTSASGNTHTLDISSLTPGLYFIRVTTETGVSVGRFIRQK